MKTPPTRISLAPLILVCAVVVAVTTPSAHAQIPCSYDVQIIASPLDCGLGTVNTFGLGLNEHGDVVGYYFCPLWDHDEAFVWTAEEGFVTLERPQGVSSAIAVDINDQGSICGTLLVSGVGYRGFVYDQGEWTILPPVVDVPGARSSANAINNAWTVVGQRSTTKDLNPQVAYMWSGKDGFNHLDGLEELSSAAAIKGDIITGWTANPGEFKEGFLWDDGRVTLLGPISGGLSSDPAAVTNEGVIVGSGAIPMDGYQFGIPLAFLWKAGEFTIIGTLPNHLVSHAFDISSSQQQVVGVSWIVDDNPNISHGFVWEKGVMHNLNNLLSPRLEVSTRSAGAIDNSGQIVADGTDAKDNAVVLMLTPAEALPGDLNGDCAVGVIDLLMLLNSWGPCADCDDCAADLNNNCVVGVPDLLILLGNWG